SEELAEKAEARSRANPEPHLDDWTTLQLERFLQQLRSEHESEMRELLAAAEQRANASIKHAEAESDLIASYQRAMRTTAEPEQPTASARLDDQPQDPALAALPDPGPTNGSPEGIPGSPPVSTSAAGSWRPSRSLAGVATRVAHAAT